MKKILMQFACLFTAVAFTLSAETPKITEASIVSLREVVLSPFSQEKAKSIHSAKFIYEVSGKNIPNAYLVIRAKKKGFVRFDIITDNAFYTACKNLDDYWGFESKKGNFVLSKEEVRDMCEDLVFLPIPFLNEKKFEQLKYDGPAIFRKTKCNAYITYPFGKPNDKYKIWLDEKTNLLCLIEFNGGANCTTFREYHNFDGVKLPSMIQLSSPDGVVVMKLHSVDWNVELADSIFLKNDPRKDGSLTVLQKRLAEKKSVPVTKTTVAKKTTPAPVVAKKDPEAIKRANKQKRINYLEREVRTLRIKINAKQKRLDQLEALFKEDRGSSVQLAANDVNNGYRRTWSYGGWGYYGHSMGRSRNNRKLEKTLMNESKDVMNEYERLSRELTNMQIELSDTEATLANLRGDR